MKDVAASTPSRTGDIGFSHIQVKLPPCPPSSNVGVLHRYPERVKLRGDDELAESRIADIASSLVQKSRIMHETLTYVFQALFLCILYVRNEEAIWRFTDTRG
jgi:hypothetical protein